MGPEGACTRLIRQMVSDWNTTELFLPYVLLSCQPRVTVTSSFVYKVIRDFESIEHLCINPIHKIGLIHTSDLSIRVGSSGVYKLMFT